MQNDILKSTITDNRNDSFITINPTKQQFAFFPKEESQMFTSKSYTNLGTKPAGYETDPTTESENNSTRVFANSIKSTDIDCFSSDPNVQANRLAYWDTQRMSLNDPAIAFQLLGLYRYGIYDVNSSHTATDYIGAVNFTVPYIINQSFADYKYFNNSSNTVNNLYDTTDTEDKIVNLFTGMQKIRIPANRFNQILTDPTDIEKNGGDNIKPIYGTYYVTVSPKYIQTSVMSIIQRQHIPWRYRPSNAIDQSVYSDPSNPANMELHLVPAQRRRNVIICDKTDFNSTVWLFENNPRQSGRLYGSVVEVWDSTGTTLKQIKVMMEDQFNFNDSTKNFECVLQPDLVGYDVDTQDIAIGDILRIYPRETYFDNIVIEISYEDSNAQIKNMISFMLNDTVRDMKTGIFEIYDSNGFTVDTAGNFNGNVIHRYQIFQKDRFEARKMLK